VQEVDWVSGACLLHRRTLGEKLGGLDERFFMYMEDIDFCLRARQAGFKVVYNPALRVLHHIGGSSRAMPVRSVIALHRSIRLYYAKHFRPNLLMRAAGEVAIWGRCMIRMAEAAVMAKRR
jgi:GT2 family glycosyltransferase